MAEPSDLFIFASAAPTCWLTYEITAVCVLCKDISSNTHQADLQYKHSHLIQMMIPQWRLSTQHWKCRRIFNVEQRCDHVGRFLFYLGQVLQHPKNPASLDAEINHLHVQRAYPQQNTSKETRCSPLSCVVPRICEHTLPAHSSTLKLWPSCYLTQASRLNHRGRLSL